MLSDLPPEQMAAAIRRAIEGQVSRSRPIRAAAKSEVKPESTGPEPRLAVKASYTVADFLTFHDEAFVVNAHVGILQRKPDRRAIDRWLKKLHAGTPRIELLRELRFSPEGKARNVRVLGLSYPGSATNLESRRRLVREQVESLMAGSIDRLKRQVRSLKRRLAKVEGAVTPPESSIEKIRVRWEGMPSSRTASSSEPRDS